MTVDRFLGDWKMDTGEKRDIRGRECERYYLLRASGLLFLASSSFERQTLVSVEGLLLVCSIDSLKDGCS